ncbi:unnamed protein product [Cyclocybe aegerita]|uniref:Nucleoprotein TPR/MLP1 domain-containing protein n=1 Tax=Cyclocybe aegerita TaxID=1973307 RepID=A0A8S0W564_CYCAE|nr:unnamed protein product [Cyclocybe aegerita]
MTMTRRKSKAAAVEHDADGSEAPHSLTVTLPDDIDEDTLSTLLPDTNFTTITSEDVVALYRLLASQFVDLDAAQRERDETQGELQRKEIELEQAMQDQESSASELQATVESIREELKQVKQERGQLAESKAALETQLANVCSSQSTSTSQVEALQRRLDDAEREKRDLVVVISRLKEEGSQRDEEIQTLRANLKEARQEHQALESQVRELRSMETSTKFKIDSLTQQLQLSQGEAERVNNELNAKTEEFAKYRRSKHAETATLQAEFDSLTQSHASAEASFKALQSAHTAQAHQLTQALSKVQELTGQLAEQEARYANEASGLKRLVSMMEEREKQAKEIVDNIEREWASVGEKAERRENILKDEVERERKARQEAEKRVEQLEGVLERMGRGELPVPTRGTSLTPFRGTATPDMTMDGMMGLSPTVAMASKAQRTGKTFTEVYADYVRLQEEYARKSAEYDHMDRTLSSVLAQIEERAPILSQQRVEYERLQLEASQLGSQLSQALSERDAQASLAQEQTQKLQKSMQENTVLQRNLDDLGRQIQVLLRDIARRDDPSIPPDEEIDPIASVEVDTQTLISNHLVLFKSIGTMQVQNQRLLRIIREFGDKMEQEEREYRETMEREQAEAVREAHEAMQDLAAQLERQKKSSDGIIQAYVKERDALKGLLAKAQAGSTVMIVNGETTSAPPSDLAQELAEVQSQFDAYKLEMGVDSSRLRDELIAAQREVNTMSASLAKSNAKIEFLTDRHRMHEEQFRVHNFEIEELSKRNSHLHEQNVRLDIECARVTDELQGAANRVEQLRNECANLRAEKKIWESIQTRLVDENRTLAMERSHLADLMSNVQKMHNDLERSGENDRRRLEGQLQMLEAQTQDLRAQIVQERDSIRNISLQKEIELKDLQTRLDKNTQEFSKTRETLVELQTSKKHLEEKIDDLTRQLKGNEEKLAVYERRPGTSGIAQSVDQDASREQQLETEVAELRAALKVTEVDLASARSHRDQFQEISQASETALAALNSTFDEYKASSEAQIARHESERQAMQERLDQATKELAELRTQYNEIQKTFEAERTAWINDKKTLEDTIVDMSTSEKHSESDRSTREQEMRSLEDRAKAAEQRYSQEIIAHAESMKSIDALKKELSASQTAARQYLNAQETAQAKLVSSENSWRQQKEALDKEVADLNARCQDLSQQNSVLHQHLESVSAQATRIRQAADAPVDSTTTNAEGETTDESDNRISELRSVINYLRKEKGIVDLQLEMSKRENGVLKSQIERLSQTLQETRATLAEERERAIANTASAAQHAELVERINQLNILRESNATLRAEAESAAKKARDLEVKLNDLSKELDPAKEQARSAQAELNATKVQMQRLEQESRRWQERNAQLLSKYDRIDPSEVQALKDEIEKLKTEASTAQGQLATKEGEAAAQAKRLEAVEQNLRAYRESANKNTQSFRAKLGELNTQKSTLTEQKQTLEAKVASLEQEITALQAAAASKPDAPTENAAQTAEMQKQNTLIASLQEERDKLLAEKETWSKAPAAATESTGGAPPAEWEAEKVQLIKARDEALEKLKTATGEAQKYLANFRNIKFQNDKFQSRIQDLMRTKAADAEKQAAAITEAVEKTKADMTTNANAAADPAAHEQLLKKHAEELRALEEKLKAQHSTELKAAVDSAKEEAFKSRPQPTPAPAPANQQAAIDAAVAELKARQAEEIASAVERGRMEQSAKTKLKDSQLVKAQKRVKDLELQIKEWQSSGLVPQTPLMPTAGGAAPSTSAAPGAAKPPAITGPTAQGGQPAAGPSQLKHVPVVAAANAAAATTQPAPAGGAGGLPRRPGAPTPGGVPLGRGGARVPPTRPMPGGAGRGNAPLRQAPVKQTAPAAPAATSGGVSIMGAASKRPREEAGSTSSDDSLAKRLKPAPAAS